MSIEEKPNFPTYQNSNSVEYPQNEKEVSNFIKKFYKSGVPIELIGSGSKRKIGKPLQCAKTLSLSKLDGIIEYLPEELYIKVKACTSIKQIEEELKKNKQQLAFEPIDFGHLLNRKSDFGTAAGQVACNISGPRRFKAGGVRDHVLGFRGVNGKGEIIKSGGNVVKNVTGYDLSKLVCGSYGTLIALTEITFKVLPKPEESKTLIIHEQKIEPASFLLEKATSSSNDISGAAFFPDEPRISECAMNPEPFWSVVLSTGMLYFDTSFAPSLAAASYISSVYSSGFFVVCSLTVFSYFSQNSFSYLFHHSSFASKSFVYFPQSASGVFPFPSSPHFVLL